MSRLKFIIAFSVASVALHLSLQASSSDFEGLLQDSPFGHAPAALGLAATTGALLEFRGVVAEGGEMFFSIYETSSRSSHWVGLNENGYPYVILNYESRTDQIVVRYQGRSLTLPFKQAKVSAQATVEIPASATQAALASASVPLASRALAEQVLRLGKLSGADSVGYDRLLDLAEEVLRLGGLADNGLQRIMREQAAHVTPPSS